MVNNKNKAALLRSELANRSKVLQNGVFDQVGGTCHAAALAKGMRDALGESDSWMYNKYVELVNKFGFDGAQTFSACLDFCRGSGLTFKQVEARDAMNWIGESNVGLIISCHMSQVGGDRFQDQPRSREIYQTDQRGDAWRHSMVVVGKVADDGLIIQNSWGENWGTGDGTKAVSYSWFEEHTLFRITRQCDANKHWVNVYAGRGVAGASAKTWSLQNSAGYLQGPGASARAALRNDEVSAIGRASAFEDCIEGRYAGASVHLSADTGVQFGGGRSEVSLLGFGFKFGRGGLQINTPVFGVTVGDASTLRDT